MKKSTVVLVAIGGVIGALSETLLRGVNFPLDLNDCSQILVTLGTIIVLSGLILRIFEYFFGVKFD